MQVLQTVKYYKPSKGGMESVVESIVEGITQLYPDSLFTVYANSHFPLYRKSTLQTDNITVIKEFTPFLYKSQPFNLIYPSLKKLIEKADIIHHHYPFPNMEFALLRNKKLLKHKKLIITWHANIENSRWGWIEKYYSPMIKQLLDIASQIIVTSPQLFNNSKILQQYKEKVSVIPLSFNPQFTLRQNAREFPEKKIMKLLFVGKLRTYKGLKYLIEAIKDLNVNLTIVGDGENELSLIEQVTELGLQQKITFFKDLSNEELREIYNTSDLFILPSINEAEAFGVVQLEAMSNALPVINTNLNSGVPYVSINGFTGLTVEPQNSGALKNAIIKIMNDKELYELFSRNALERIKDFSIEKLAQSYVDKYNL